jgi:hypothetical protein
VILWDQGLESAEALKKGGIDTLCVRSDPEQWRKAGFSVVLSSQSGLEARTKLSAPGVASEVQVASATRSPWVIANGWQFIRTSSGKYLYDLSRGQAALAAAEAYAYDADAILKIDPADVIETGQMLGFLRQLKPHSSVPLADLVVVDDGSALVGEVMNLLVRRNLLFKVASAPDPQFQINVQLGTAQYSKKEAANPAELALKIRHQVTDEQRFIRVYGSEVVLCRLTGNRSRLRLHLLNYGGNQLEGLRLRVRGSYITAKAYVFGRNGATLDDYVMNGGATEFSLSEMGVYSVVDLEGQR